MKELNEVHKIWFRELLDTEIDNEKGTVANEKTWEQGSPDRTSADFHRSNAESHSDYIQFLEGLKARYCGTH